MKIAIDAREALGSSPSGKGFFAKKVIEELKARNSDLLLLGKENDGFLWHKKTAKMLMKDKPADLYLSPTSYIVPWLLKEKFPYALVVHDLIAFHHESHNRKAKLIEHLTLKRALKYAKHIFTVSEATKDELLHYFPSTELRKIKTIYEGPTITALQHERAKPGEVTILCAGTLCPRKNQARLIYAFNALPDHAKVSAKLIFMGARGWHDDEILRLVQNSANVEWRGYVSNTERDELLKHATIFAYPSLSEGFGLPVLDAMTMGIPVLTSNRSSMKEITGDAAVLVNPDSKEDIAKGLERMLMDHELQRSLSMKGREQAQKFSWKRTVDLMLEAIETT